MPKRQIALMMKRVGGRPGDPVPPMGTPGEVRAALSNFNTAPDGAPARAGALMEILYGPGMIVEMPVNQESVVQAMVTINDEDSAIPVLLRACRARGWTMVDLDTGRSFG